MASAGRFKAENLKDEHRFRLCDILRYNLKRNYRIFFLLPGNYRIRIEHAGFKTIERRGIRVSLGSDVALDFVLEVAAVFLRPVQRLTRLDGLMSLV